MSETNYFVLGCPRTEEDAGISSEPKLPREYRNWKRANVIPEGAFDTPLEYTVNRDDEGQLLTFYKALRAPLMTQKMVDVLVQAGVDNLQIFDAQIKIESTGQIIDDYKAVNIVGLISAADLGDSEFVTSPLANRPKFSTSFDKLVVDEDKVNGALFFRMAESVSTILVHRSVKEALEPLFPRLRFKEPEDFSN